MMAGMDEVREMMHAAGMGVTVAEEAQCLRAFVEALNRSSLRLSLRGDGRASSSPAVPGSGHGLGLLHTTEVRREKPAVRRRLQRGR